MAVHLDKAPHAWQVGLDDPAGRVCDTLVCPTEANIARLCLALGKAGLRAIPVVGYAHLTIDSRESKAEFGVGEIPKPFAWRATGIEATPYGVRLTLDVPAWEDVLDACSAAPRDPYLTLAYARWPVEVDLRRLGSEWYGIKGECRMVEHRRFDDSCRAFQPSRISAR